MVKEIRTVHIPNCPKCDSKLEARVTTELDEHADPSIKPAVLIFFGICENCHKIYVFDLVKTDTLPSTQSEFIEAIKKLDKSNKQKIINKLKTIKK